ncbi:MAG: hypothetical protein A3E91_02845 [Candidatus Moranbacteria bacterium RIFCSPHIGHO2_12_FULL_40_10]|nr:MAG: hypothetical protein A3E91_02845 [Candidatus Moranbacteria bacterium RIFCSPHIGHO2_12_FULL_40_10]
MKDENAPIITEGQKFEIAGSFVRNASKILDGVPFDIAKEFVETAVLEDIFRGSVIQYCNVRDAELKKISVKKKPNLFSKILSAQERFYKEEFGKKCDFAGLIIPDAKKIFAWLMCMTEKVGIEELLSGGKNPQPSWKYTNSPLDKVINLEFGRDGHKEPYIFRAKANIEADGNLKNISANKIAEIGIKTMGLKERLALGRFLYWFRKKKIILDAVNWTLSSGSRFSDGGVPGVDDLPDAGGVGVSRFAAGVAGSRLRSREVVS